MQKESINNIMECQQEVGRTTDEILLFYINNFQERTSCTDTALQVWNIISRPTLKNIRDNIWKQEEIQKVKIAQSRSKKLIINVAIYTNMPFSDVKLALELSGHTFNNIDPRDMAIVEWLCKDDIQRDIRELNDLILKHCRAAGFTEEQIDGYLYPVLVEKSSK